VGRPLKDVVKTFPAVADHINWVKNGDVGLAPGTPYGVGRTTHSDGYTANMPAFGATLTEEQIDSVVHYERVEFGGEAANAPAAASTATTVATGSNGSGGSGSSSSGQSGSGTPTTTIAGSGSK
jgi:hypothetical protein